VKVSNEKVAEHREALLATAKRLLQERGFDGAAVSEISRAAGLTQGALYGQFKSKDALAAEAIRKAFADGVAAWGALRGQGPDALTGFLNTYLCQEHLQDPGQGCVLAACVSEVSRQDPAIGEAYAEGFRHLADMVRQVLPAEIPPAEARARTLALLTGVVGSISVARALEKADPDLAVEILAAARAEFARLAVVPERGQDA
jgi:TetR/AcrR family transcriptional regulator, transcriptional repressor for nem operon